MCKSRRYIDYYKKAVKGLIAIFIATTLIVGCGKESAEKNENETLGSVIDFDALKAENSDIFAWIYVPGTDINGPVVQNGEGDDEFYATHNVAKEPDASGAYYIEAANMADMCDFNEVVHGTNVETLDSFLDRTFFDENRYIHVYMDGNALVYYVVAAYTRENTRLLEQYDFSYASGCQQFIDEMYSGKSMNKNIREGWETGLTPEHFLITLDGVMSGGDKQVVVIGCLVADAAGVIDREVDYGNPDEDS